MNNHSELVKPLIIGCLILLSIPICGLVLAYKLIPAEIFLKSMCISLGIILFVLIVFVLTRG